jgi:putative alpha-1,2-mannosidase
MIESVSKTLEYAYDDWCIAQMVQILNKKRIMSILKRSKLEEFIRLE